MWFLFQFNCDVLNLNDLDVVKKSEGIAYSVRLEFACNMVKTIDLKLGYYRLLDTDNAVVLPYGSWIRFLITSLDVIHSWAVPSLGVKLDACPGRLNQIILFLKRDGFFYGQCSEICGVYHAFMPIVIEGITLKAFIYWNWVEK
jgi:cytochrome c oxidase subunit 2